MGSRDNSTFAREVITYMEKLDNSTCWAQVVIFIWLGCCSVVAGLLGLLLGWLFSCLMYVFVYILFGLAFVLLLRGFLGYCWLVVSSFSFMSLFRLLLAGVIHYMDNRDNSTCCSRGPHYMDNSDNSTCCS